uniref:SD02447p n=1 Tax=Drosophila melanogaster TaxID=7227 RepID=Q8MSR9_DROME|nr:SD02447p [Drosophila melanogaster]
MEKESRSTNLLSNTNRNHHSHAPPHTYANLVATYTNTQAHAHISIFFRHYVLGEFRTPRDRWIMK